MKKQHTLWIEKYRSQTLQQYIGNDAVKDRISGCIEANDNIDRVTREYFNVGKREHYFELKQEVIIERGYFAGKRRYAMYIVNKEGVTVDELDMKGLDLMKSNMTPMYSKFGEKLIQDIMFGKAKAEIDQQIIDFKKYVKDIPIELLAKPTGVKNVESYIYFK